VASSLGGRGHERKNSPFELFHAAPYSLKLLIQFLKVSCQVSKTFYPWVKAEANYHKGNPGKLICPSSGLLKSLAVKGESEPYVDSLCGLVLRFSSVSQDLSVIL